MINNRALEFLQKAMESFPVLHANWGWKAKEYVALAIPEVQELLDSITQEQETHDRNHS